MNTKKLSQDLFFSKTNNFLNLYKKLQKTTKKMVDI